MDVLAILSNKGGAGKTTLSISLAVAATEAGKTVAVVDIDPQASAAEWSDTREDESPAVVSAQATRLGSVLEKAEGAGVDLAIIDTSPRTAEGTLTAARAASFALLVARPLAFDIRALTTSVDAVQLAKCPAAVVLNGVPPQGTHGDEAAEALGAYGLPIAPVRLVYRAAHYNSVITGETAIDFEPQGKAASEVRALYEWIANELADVRS